MVGPLHLTAGSDFPTLQKDVLRCYSMKFCPYAQKVLLVLRAKGIKYELININTTVKPEWFLELTPLGRVPMIQQNGHIIYESLVVMEFLNEKYPDPPLYPQDMWAKYEDKMLIDLFAIKVQSYATNLIYKCPNSQEELSNNLETAYTGLDIFEKELLKRNTPFFFGKTPGMLDFFIWPWFEKLPALAYMSDYNFPIDADRYPCLTKFIENMNQNSIVRAEYLNPKLFAKVTKVFREGKKRDFDIEL